MATETTTTHANLVCGIRGKGAPGIVDIQLPRRPCNFPAGIKACNAWLLTKVPSYWEEQGPLTLKNLP